MKYIIKLDIPEVKCCFDCPLCYDDLYCSARSDGEYIKLNCDEKPENCPLNEVIE